MSKPKFTQGPLETDFFNVEDQGVYMVRDSLNQGICQCFTQYPFAGKPGITDDEAEGNAFLYAAAPEMYAALEEILTDLDTFPEVAPGVDHPEVFDLKLKLRKLLRKARGESEYGK